MKYFIFVFLGCVGIALVFFAKQIVFPSQPPVHLHAGFQVYKNDKLLNFSSLEYMHEKPCTLHEASHKEKDDDDEQIEKAHLHDGVGDVVHVHRKGAIWEDLFINIKYSLPGPLVAYRNGMQVKNILEQEIHAYDSVVILMGTHTHPNSFYIHKSVTKKYIQTVEKRSETCGSS